MQQQDLPLRTAVILILAVRLEMLHAGLMLSKYLLELGH